MCRPTPEKVIVLNTIGTITALQRYGACFPENQKDQIDSCVHLIDFILKLLLVIAAIVDLRVEWIA